MEENKLLLSEFANEEGFELNKYLTHLFDYYLKRSTAGKSNTEPAS
ncbi:hypothetical protein [Neobacillus sp.]|nr:hypothetical protein [Neobacillus sp.]